GRSERPVHAGLPAELGGEFSAELDRLGRGRVRDNERRLTGNVVLEVHDIPTCRLEMRVVADRSCIEGPEFFENVVSNLAFSIGQDFVDLWFAKWHQDVVEVVACLIAEANLLILEQLVAHREQLPGGGSELKLLIRRPCHRAT